jgi:pimeloyl-ACP methyl ester carboxylesterase
MLGPATRTHHRQGRETRINPESQWFDGFESRSFEVNGTSIHARCSRLTLGEPQRPAMLLLHGFPRSHVIWHRLAQRLSQSYFLVMPDHSNGGRDGCAGHRPFLPVWPRPRRACRAPAGAGPCTAREKALRHRHRARGDKIACDTLVLWGERGVVNKLFKPLELWQAQCAGQVSGVALPAGHFIPEELPQPTAATLLDFFGQDK